MGSQQSVETACACGLHRRKIYEIIECEELVRTRWELQQITNNSRLGSPGPILNFEGNNWKWTARSLELARFLHHKHVATLCDYCTSCIKLESTMLPENNDPIAMQEIINVCIQTGNHTSKSTKRTLTISLEEIASKINIDGIPMVLFVFGHRYELRSVCFEVLTPDSRRHHTDLFHVHPHLIYCDGAKESFEYVTSATQLKYTGIDRATYIRVELSDNQHRNDSTTLLEKIQEYRNQGRP